MNRRSWFPPYCLVYRVAHEFSHSPYVFKQYHLPVLAIKIFAAQSHKWNYTCGSVEIKSASYGFYIRFTLHATTVQKSELFAAVDANKLVLPCYVTVFAITQLCIRLTSILPQSWIYLLSMFTLTSINECERQKNNNQWCLEGKWNIDGRLAKNRA